LEHWLLVITEIGSTLLDLGAGVVVRIALEGGLAVDLEAVAAKAAGPSTAIG
jgi:hypothetical protein